MITTLARKHTAIVGPRGPLVLLLLAAAASAWAGGAKEKTPALSQRPAFSSSDTLADEGAVQPIVKAKGRSMKIAVIASQDYPLWSAVQDGMQKAEGELEAGNCTVEWLPIGGGTYDTYLGALKSATEQKYDAIAIVAAEPGLVPAINAAVDAGIPVATFTAESSEESKRLFFVGSDPYQEGRAAAKRLADLLGGKGDVAIITGLFTATSNEQRRKGFEDFLTQSAPGITVIGRVEDREKDSIAGHEAQDFMGSDPLLTAIYVTDGGSSGVAKAVADAGKAGGIKVLCFGAPDQTMEYVKQGVITGTFREDAFAQGHDPAVRLYNYIVDGVVPPAGRLVTQDELVTKENVDQFLKTKSPQ